MTQKKSKPEKPPRGKPVKIPLNFEDAVDALIHVTPPAQEAEGHEGQSRTRPQEQAAASRMTLDRPEELREPLPIGHLPRVPAEAGLPAISPSPLPGEVVECPVVAALQQGEERLSRVDARRPTRSAYWYG